MTDLSDQGWLNVSNTTPRVAYTATSGQTQFAVPFVFHDADHLLVFDNDTLVDSDDYAVTGVDEESGGQIEFETGRTAGHKIVIVRELDYDLTTHIPPSGPLDIPSVNLQFSLFVMMLQQAVRDWTRSLRQPASDDDDLDALPAAAARASKYLAFDANGQPSLVSSVSTAVAATAFAQTLLDDPDAATARATLGITDQAAYVGISNWNHCR
ncbi:MAG: hypothetical protein KJZ73_13035 [Pseudorhodoplanes sp.]|nr:hypothetical protein [Pseudorhodoplanes sp.]